MLASPRLNMRHWTFFVFVLFIVTLCAFVNGPRTSSDCTPKLGICIVCDSLRVLHRADALALAYREAQDSTLPYYNNIIIQEARIKAYQHALGLLYNNLEDSMLFGLRSYHPPEAKDTLDFYKVTLEVSGARVGKWRKRNGTCGYTNINNILTEVGLVPVGDVVKKGKLLYADYTSDKPINKIALQRRFAAQPEPIVRVTRYISPQQYVGMLDYQNVQEWRDGDSVYLLITYPFGPGMPPEIPYPTATDFYHVRGCTISYDRTTTKGR